jgi:hypothetical protein
MELNGREVGFTYNILASLKVAKLCPDGKLENIEQLFGGTYDDDVSNTSKFMIALNAGWIASMKAQDPEFDVKPLTEDELMLLTSADYLAFQQEALKAYNAGNKRSVHTKPVQTKGKKTDAAQK